MNKEELLVYLKENNLKFSIYSLLKEYNLSKEDSVWVCKEAAKDHKCFIFYMIICPKCHMVIEYEYYRNMNKISKKKKCFKCKKSFEVKDIEYIYEFKSI